MVNINRFVFAVEIAKVAAAPRLSSGVECRYVPTYLVLRGLASTQNQECLHHR
jgi:hypothetical protein